MNMHLGDTRLLIEVGRKHGLLRNQLAYVLATAYHETAHTMKPVRETLAKTDAKAKEILTKAWKAGKLPWVKSDYWSGGYFGRGYVQLTHKANYERAGREFGVDLVNNPSLALEADIAAQIIVLGMRDGWFTGKELGDYITLQYSNFVSARRIVNGTDKDALIAGYARKYDDLLRAEGYGVTPADKPEIGIPATETQPPTGWLAALIKAISSIFKRRTA
ncbi:glycoside hydrolase family 19 protein [Falsochrobactrum shanghaiense]|nr:glycoside hydrolase family 19 protein [Falsochrobactrum shanghaiense]